MERAVEFESLCRLLGSGGSQGRPAFCFSRILDDRVGERDGVLFCWTITRY